MSITFRLFTIGLVALSIFVGSEEKKPNVIIFLVDDLGWADISLRGAPIDTPAIDSLFEEGLTLDRFYTTPICSPTRAALMTGRDPLRLGISYSVVMPWIITVFIQMSILCQNHSKRLGIKLPW